MRLSSGERSSHAGVRSHGGPSRTIVSVGLRCLVSKFALVRLLCEGDTANALRFARRAGWISAGADATTISGEGREAATKLAGLGLTIPWKTVVKGETGKPAKGPLTGPKGRLV